MIAIAREQQIILPHVVFATMFEHYPQYFQETFVGATGRISKFWNDMVCHPNYASCIGSTGWQSRTVPLALHGDGTLVSGVGKSWSRLLDIFSWRSLLAAGSTLDYTILIFAAFSQLLTKSSMTAVWTIIAWSLSVLADGVWPLRSAFGNEWPVGSVDFERAGKALAGGFRAVLFVIMGDHDYYSVCLGLQHHASGRPCSWCPANNVSGDPMNWAEFRPDVRQWSSELWTPGDWLEAHPARHVLFLLTRASILHVYPDWMHSKHMGTDAYLYASVLWLLVYRMLAGTPDENLTTVWNEMLSFYKTRGISGHYTNMYIGMFTRRATPNSQYPKMRGRAAEIKLLGLALLFCWLQHYDASSVVDGQIRLLLRASVSMETALADYKDHNVLPPEVYSEFMKTCNDFCILYTALHQHFLSAGTLLFNVTPKLHFVWHAAWFSQYLHPRASWCYSGNL